MSDMDVQYVHISGLDNRVADFLSRWTGSHRDLSESGSYLDPSRYQIAGN